MESLSTSKIGPVTAGSNDWLLMKNKKKTRATFLGDAVTKQKLQSRLCSSDMARCDWRKGTCRYAPSYSLSSGSLRGRVPFHTFFGEPQELEVPPH
jgi:hypothetical protein